MRATTARQVATALLALAGNDTVGVANIDAALSDTAAFCEHYQVAAAQAANSVVLEAKRDGASFFATCVVLGTTRADINGLARRTLASLPGALVLDGLGQLKPAPATTTTTTG